MLAERGGRVKRRYANAVFRNWVGGARARARDRVHRQLSFPRGRGGPAKPRSPPEILAPRVREGTERGDWLPPYNNNTTPAKARAQLGDVANGRQRSVTRTFPTGPRPSPGWRHARERPPVGPGEAVPYGQASSCRPRSRAHALSRARVRVSSWPYQREHSSRSTASCRAVPTRSSRSDAPAPACVPPSARAAPRGCRG